MNTNSSDTRLSVEAVFSGAIHVGKAGTPYQEFLMLWTKGWLETRPLVVLSLIFFAVNIAAEFIRIANPSPNPPPALSEFLVLWVFVPALLAGNGIRPPARLRTRVDAQRSLYFTLSLPVSRFRLLAVRTVIGIAETVAVVVVTLGAIWTFLPSFRINATPQDAILYVLTLLGYTSGFYFLSMLLAALLEGPWRVWGTVFLIFGARWVVMHLPQHAFDILAPIVSETPLVTHALPWKAIGMCIGLAVVCFGAAAKAVQVREY